MHSLAVVLAHEVDVVQEFSPLSAEMPMLFNRSGLPLNQSFPMAGPTGGIRILLDQLDSKIPHSSYSPMAGYARVTAQDMAGPGWPEVIAVTPLFVEGVVSDENQA